MSELSPSLSLDTQKLKLEEEIEKWKNEKFDRRCWWCEQKNKVTIADRVKVIGNIRV